MDKLAQVHEERQTEMQVKERMKITEKKIAHLTAVVAQSSLQPGLYTWKRIIWFDCTLFITIALFDHELT